MTTWLFPAHLSAFMYLHLYWLLCEWDEGAGIGQVGVLACRDRECHAVLYSRRLIWALVPYE